MDQKNILVVEDEKDLLELLSNVLTRMGYQVTSAEGVKQAQELFSQSKPQVVLSDIQMEDGNGLDLLKSWSQTKAPPLLFAMTGQLEYSLEDAYDAGASFLFRKPFSLEQMIQVIKKYEAIDPLVVRPPRYFYSQDIHLNFSGQGLKGTVLNLGRGGFYVNLADSQLEVGDRFEFNIPQPFSLNGEAQVSWVKENSGFGAQFVLTDNKRLHFWLRQLEPLDIMVQDVKSKSD